MSSSSNALLAVDVIIEGRIVRKRKRRECMVLAISSTEKDTTTTNNVIVPYDHPSLPFCFLDASVRIQTHIQDDELIHADSIDLVQCAPDPKAIQYVLEGVLDGRFPEWTLPLEKQQLQEIVANQKRPDIRKIVRLLRGVERDPRQRIPHTKRRDLELLDDVESKTILRTIQPRPLMQMQQQEQHPLNNNNNNNSTTVLHLPSNIDKDRVSRGLTRVEYIQDKKQPQVQWMTQRIRELQQVPNHIVDVGGGRGDLAMGIAQAFSSSTIITVVDKNESSLVVGREQAISIAGDRMNFVHADFFDFMQYPSSYLPSSDKNNTPPIDLVVALHACGDLSDLAMAFALQLKIPFVVCPCCYTKRYIPKFLPKWHDSWTDHELQVVGRLAELNERPIESKRARRIINSMRLGCIEENDWKLYLEEYDSTSSLRNLVLIGDR